MKTKGRKSDGIVKKCMKSMESGMQMAYGTKKCICTVLAGIWGNRNKGGEKSENR